MIRQSLRIALSLGLFTTVGWAAPGGVDTDNPNNNLDAWRDIGSNKPTQDLLSKRETNWNDDSAIPAGAKMDGQSSVTELGIVSPGAKEIRTYLSKLTNEAVSDDAVTQLIDRLSKVDRERLTANLMKEYPELNKVISDFRSAWKDKYDESFDFSKAANFSLASSRILQGDITDQAILAGQKIGPSLDTDTPKRQSEPTGDRVTSTAKQNMDKNRATAVIPLDRERNLPQLTLHLTNEGMLMSDWRLNAPLTLTVTSLHDNLKARLTALTQDKANWPVESRDGYTIVSHHVLAALADIPFSTRTTADDKRQSSLDVED